MEQEFQLYYHGGLTVFEQANMTAEDRAWWLKRTIKELKDHQDQEKSQMKSIPKPRASRRR